MTGTIVEFILLLIAHAAAGIYSSTLKYSPERLLIKIDNPCRQNLTFDETLYGIGIRSVIATTHKYEGMYDFTAEDGVFSAKIILNLK